jgi:hypothetical protein
MYVDGVEGSRASYTAVLCHFLRFRVHLSHGNVVGVDGSLEQLAQARAQPPLPAHVGYLALCREYGTTDPVAESTSSLPRHFAARWKGGADGRTGRDMQALDIAFANAQGYPTLAQLLLDVRQRFDTVCDTAVYSYKRLRKSAAEDKGTREVEGVV